MRRLGGDVAATDRAQPRYHVLDQVRRRDDLVSLALRDSEPELRQSRVEFALVISTSRTSITHAVAGVPPLQEKVRKIAAGDKSEAGLPLVCKSYNKVGAGWPPDQHVY